MFIIYIIKAQREEGYMFYKNISINKKLVISIIIVICTIIITIISVNNMNKSGESSSIAQLKKNEINNAIENYENVTIKSGILAKMSIDDLKETSVLIAYGTVVDKSDSFIIEAVNGTKSVFTDYYLKLSCILRGDCNCDIITIRVEGGVVGDTCVVDEAGPVFEEENDYLVFLKKPIMGWYTTEGDYYYVNGAVQGVYELSNNNDSITVTNVNALASSEKTVYMDAESEIDSASIELVSFADDMIEYNKENSVDEDYLKNQFLSALKQNLDNNLITQEDYDETIAQMSKYANIKNN